ncbi:MAG: hypothetical protein HYU97_08290 [Deltaproteobacteria bacterium]|nr:hypothetical protein [Deltaproteobacteria bacterium]
MKRNKAFSLLFILLLSSPALAIMNIKIEDTDVDGVKARKLNCQLSQASFMGSIMMTAFLGSNKKTFESCGLKGKEVSLEWVWNAGKVDSLKLLNPNDSTLAACLSKGLQGQAIEGSGKCQGYVSVPY